MGKKTRQKQKTILKKCQDRRRIMFKNKKNKDYLEMKVKNKDSNKDLIETKIKSDKEAIQFHIDSIKNNNLKSSKECGFFIKPAKINKKVNKFRMKRKIWKN